MSPPFSNDLLVRARYFDEVHPVYQSRESPLSALVVHLPKRKYTKRKEGENLAVQSSNSKTTP